MHPVSVIIPTFNRKEKLVRAIRSVLAQKPLIFEILVIDDGSDDGTAQMVQKEFPDVRYFFHKNQGPAAARNRGIEQSRGGWIAFLDSDDEWLPGKIEAQLRFFEDHPEFPLNQTEEIWIRNGRRVNPMKKHKKYGGWIFNECLPLCMVSPSAVMLKRDLFNEVGLFDESLPACEDYDLWLRIACRYPIGLIERPYIIKYGGHPDQRSHQFPAMDRFRIQSLIKLLRSGILNGAQIQSAAAELEKKSQVFIRGALKHGKEKEANDTEMLVSKTLESLKRGVTP